MPESRHADRPIFITLLVLLVCLPYPRGSTFDLAWLGMALVLTFASIWWLILYTQSRTSLTVAFTSARPVLLIFIAWLGWLAIQILPLPIDILEAFAPLSATAYKASSEDIEFATISIDVSATYQELLMSICYLLVFTLTLLLVSNTRRLKQLIAWLLMAGVVQALLANFLVFSEQHIFYISSDHSAQGSFANRNQLAGYLTQILAIGIGSLLANMRSHGSLNWRDRVRNIASTLLSSKVRQRVYLAIMVITLVLTHSRMGNTAFFGSMTLVGVLALLLMKRSPRPIVLLLASLLIIDIAIVSQWFGLERLQQRFDLLNNETATLNTQTNTVGRIDTALYTKELHADASLTGTGAGTYFAAFPAYQGPDQQGYFQHAHNDYLEFLTDTGWIGIGLLGLMVAFSLFNAIQALRTRRTPLFQGMAFSSSMGIIAMLIHSSTDFNLRIPATTAIFMVILALAYIARFLESQHQSAKM